MMHQPAILNESHASQFSRPPSWQHTTLCAARCPQMRVPGRCIAVRSGSPGSGPHECSCILGSWESRILRPVAYGVGPVGSPLPAEHWLPAACDGRRNARASGRWPMVGRFYSCVRAHRNGTQCCMLSASRGTPKACAGFLWVGGVQHARPEKTEAVTAPPMPKPMHVEPAGRPADRPFGRGGLSSRLRLRWWSFCWKLWFRHLWCTR